MTDLFRIQNENKDKIEKMKDKLLPHQKEALKPIRWVLYGARATGRTYTICIVTILEAMEHIGYPVKIYDHFTDQATYIRDWIFPNLHAILREHELGQYFELNRQNKTITYNPMRVLERIEKNAN
jgi:hypothetical protein